MKKALPILACVALSMILISATCKTEDPDPTPEPAEQQFTCKCTYIPASGGPSEGQPNKEESTTLTSRYRDEAKVDCGKLESKWMSQFFSGTCVLQ